METVLVSRAGGVLGQVRHDPSTDQFDPDPSVPRDVVSDIIVTYYRDNVLFGQNRDGTPGVRAPSSRRDVPSAGKTPPESQRADEPGP